VVVSAVEPGTVVRSPRGTVVVQKALAAVLGRAKRLEAA
jgi:hypothetical protein